MSYTKLLREKQGSPSKTLQIISWELIWVHEMPAVAAKQAANLYRHCDLNTDLIGERDPLPLPCMAQARVTQTALQEGLRKLLPILEASLMPKNKLATFI